MSVSDSWVESGGVQSDDQWDTWDGGNETYQEQNHDQDLQWLVPDVPPPAYEHRDAYSRDDDQGTKHKQQQRSNGTAPKRLRADSEPERRRVDDEAQHSNAYNPELCQDDGYGHDNIDNDQVDPNGDEDGHKAPQQPGPKSQRSVTEAKEWYQAWKQPDGRAAIRGWAQSATRDCWEVGDQAYDAETDRVNIHNMKWESN